eukprot:2072353-Amphidinium_carterae.2
MQHLRRRRQLSDIIRSSSDGRLRTVFASVPDDVFEKVKHVHGITCTELVCRSSKGLGRDVLKEGR